ncbi:MAG: LysM peptidoglycan-binding domain-containing protein [Deltaproteobacteria bacterium]|nr:LysM peptidoglycan-binding domain-containing protein [Deltaproteobacteria bacterium]
MFELKRLVITALLILLFSSCIPPNGSVQLPSPAQTGKTPVDRESQASQAGRHLEPAQADISEDPSPPDTESPDQGEPSEKNHTRNNQQAIMDEALAFLEQAQLLWEKGDPDNALKLLDEAYSLVLDVDGDPEIAWQKDDLRVMIAKKIVEIYTSRSHVAAGYQSEIPLVMNEDVEAAIRRFQGPERAFFLSSYQRSGRYRPMILKELKEAGLPEELSWLPLVESGFKIKALSKARALGLWQIIPSTGYRYGLRRDLWIDERMDPEKATRAAIVYLKELHEIFGDWLTVLAAYNCGEGRVLRAISQQQMNYLDNFWDLYRQLPFETSNYVPRFLATLHIIQDPEKYGIDLHCDQEKPLFFDAVTTEKSVKLTDIAARLDVPAETLEILNAELRYKVTPKNYELKIPEGMEEKFALIIDTTPEAKKPGGAQYLRYKVKRGDTLSVIARRYKTSVNAILAANHLTSKHRIRAGTWLKIPSRGYVYSESSIAPPLKGGEVTTYSVQKGDSLWLIAKRFGTTISDIKRLNGLRSNDLSIGQVIKIRGSTAEDAGTYSKTYIVRRGDTLSTIASQNRIGLTKLLRLNNLSRNSLIYPGQVITIR